MEPTNLQKIYDQFAEQYDNKRELFEIHDIIKQYYSHLGINNGHLLDLGCGTGIPVAQFFVNKGWSVTGVDFSQKMLSIAKINVPKIKTVHSDIRTINFKDNQFNAITLVYSFFHIPQNQHKEVLHKIYQCLTTEGKVLITYATKEYTGSEEFDGYKEFMGQQLYYSHTSPNYFYNLLKETGFGIVLEEYQTISGETFLWLTLEKLRST